MGYKTGKLTLTGRVKMLLRPLQFMTDTARNEIGMRFGEKTGCSEGRYKRFGRKDRGLIFILCLSIGVFTIFLFFLLQFLHHLAFAVAFQFRPGFILTLLCVRFGIGSIVKNDDSPVKGLHCESNEKKKGYNLSDAKSIFAKVGNK